MSDRQAESWPWQRRRASCRCRSALAPLARPHKAAATRSAQQREAEDRDRPRQLRGQRGKAGSERGRGRVERSGEGEGEGVGEGGGWGGGRRGEGGEGGGGEGGGEGREKGGGRRGGRGEGTDLLPVRLRAGPRQGDAPKHPEWRTTPPFNAILKGDMKAFRGIGGKGPDASHGSHARRHDDRRVVADGRGLAGDGTPPASQERVYGIPPEQVLRREVKGERSGRHAGDQNRCPIHSCTALRSRWLL